MKILFSPQVREGEKIAYEFTDNVIKATYKGTTDTFDFSEFGDGKLQVIDEETGEQLIETSLEESVIISARRDKGVMHVELLNVIGPDATHDECFPEWIDHTEYVSPKPVEEEIVEETVEEDIVEEEDSIIIESPSEEETVEEEDSIIIEPSGEEGVEGWDDY